MKRNVKKYSEFINETEQKVIYNTNFSGMVQGAVSNIYSQILAIAQELSNEKKLRNPYRYGDVAQVEEVDITRAINMIFHSDWKKSVKAGEVQEWAKECIRRAGKHDDRSNKKNDRALRSMTTGNDNYKDIIQLNSIENSRNNRTQHD
jgi:hypothetical protein